MVKKIILKNYEKSDLDRMVIRFVNVLSKYTDYVIVSGYISILFGNYRPTIDVDILYREMDEETMKRFIKEVKEAGFRFIDREEDVFSILEVKKEKINLFDERTEWQIDFKKAKSRYDFESINNRIEVLLDDVILYIAPIEFQICYKLALLGSDKDIKDAAYLYNYFKSRLDLELLKKYADELNADISLIDETLG